MEKKSGTVIVCDDNDDILDVISTAIRHAGHSVLTARCSDELMPLIDQNKPDLLLCDIRMPGRDGLDIAEQLHSRDRTIPIVLMTAFNSTFYRAYAPYVGVTEVLAKPIDFDQLLTRIDTILKDVHGDTRAN